MSGSGKGIKEPHAHDVLSGRGNFVNYHEGNEYFRKLVRQHKIEYVKCPKQQKGKFSKLIVDEIKARNPPGRFLKQDADTKLWFEIGEKKALDKTRQALREGAPEIMKEEGVKSNKSAPVAAIGVNNKTKTSQNTRHSAPAVQQSMQQQLHSSDLSILHQSIMSNFDGMESMSNSGMFPHNSGITAQFSPNNMMSSPLYSPGMVQQNRNDNLRQRLASNQNGGEGSLSQLLPPPQVHNPASDPSSALDLSGPSRQQIENNKMFMENQQKQQEKQLQILQQQLFLQQQQQQHSRNRHFSAAQSRHSDLSPQLQNFQFPASQSRHSDFSKMQLSAQQEQDILLQANAVAGNNIGSSIPMQQQSSEIHMNQLRINRLKEKQLLLEQQIQEQKKLELMQQRILSQRQEQKQQHPSEMQKFQSRLGEIYDKDYVKNDDPLVPGGTTQSMPTRKGRRQGLVKERSLKMENIFEHSIDGAVQPSDGKKEYDASMMSMSGTSFVSMGDYGEEGDLSALFDASMKLNPENYTVGLNDMNRNNESCPPSNNKHGIKSSETSNVSKDSALLGMSLATISSTEGLTESTSQFPTDKSIGNMSHDDNSIGRVFEGHNI